ncbi:MAG: tRNA (adenosine(37)-N6)-threonylcarbamoyltransferase complex dimerization subunit type 1 TsaB [Acidimicrobiia bacterium]|nr:tRNA (adenosine(37)-N6)-threonylcarbamoyltransferase complex dimerization subunit type 1 TsaB [Acidimicrobiia bacterium]
MLILGIETSTTQVGCAVGGHEGILAYSAANRGQRHAEQLVPAIQFTCRSARVELREVSAVAVGLGPGLFTGLRVGIATAKAMAQALRVPMIGIPSLDLLAFRVRFTSRLIVVASDARRGELFHATYRPSPGGVQRVTAHQVGTPEEVASDIEASGEEVLLVGDGALRYAELFSSVRHLELADGGLAHPSAGALVQLAHAQALREEFVTPAEVRPIYLRKPDAEVHWVERGRVVGGAP